MTPGKNWIGVGRFNTGQESVGCTFTMTSQILTAPAGKLVANVTNMVPTFIPYQNVSLTAGNTTVHASSVTAQSVIYRVPNVPVGTVYLVVNITIPNTYTLSVSGASFPVTANPGSTYGILECTTDTGHTWSQGANDVHQLFCFSPRWNESYYINVDIGAGNVALIAAEFRAVTCPDGWTGATCTDPLYQFDIESPDTLSFSGYAASGAVHVYFDVPAYYWNASVFFAIDNNSSNSGNLIYLREATYSSSSPFVYGIYPDQPSLYTCTSKLRFCDFSRHSGSASSGLAPFDLRF